MEIVPIEYACVSTAVDLSTEMNWSPVVTVALKKVPEEKQSTETGCKIMQKDVVLMEYI
jgi:hypothetical protein